MATEASAPVSVSISVVPVPVVAPVSTTVPVAVAVPVTAPVPVQTTEPNNHNPAATTIAEESDYDGPVHFNHLADELTLHIFSFLSASQLCKLAAVCKRWKDFSEDNQLWKNLCYVDFLQLEQSKVKSSEKASVDPLSSIFGNTRKRKKKDPKKPKRNQSSYLIFCQQQRAKVRLERPSLTFGEIQKELARRWKNLSEDDKKIYQKKATEDKSRYTEEMNDYWKAKTVENMVVDGPSCYKKHYRNKFAEAAQHKVLSRANKRQRTYGCINSIAYLHSMMNSHAFGHHLHFHDSDDDSDSSDDGPFFLPGMWAPFGCVDSDSDSSDDDSFF